MDRFPKSGLRELSHHLSPKLSGFGVREVYFTKKFDRIAFQTEEFRQPLADDTGDPLTVDQLVYFNGDTFVNL